MTLNSHAYKRLISLYRKVLIRNRIHEIEEQLPHFKDLESLENRVLLSYEAVYDASSRDESQGGVDLTLKLQTICGGYNLSLADTVTGQALSMPVPADSD